MVGSSSTVSYTHLGIVEAAQEENSALILQVSAGARKYAKPAYLNNTERMKVTTCLNPLHTALAVYGCLLGYTSIAAEMWADWL